MNQPWIFVNGPKSTKNRKCWTLVKFLEITNRIHKNRFDYSRITTDQIKNKNSRVIIGCRSCRQSWSSSVANHARRGARCPHCSKRSRYTLKELISRSIQTHGRKFDYSLIHESMIKGSMTEVPLGCRVCEHKWFVTINDHVNKGRGCPNC